MKTWTHLGLLLLFSNPSGLHEIGLWDLCYIALVMMQTWPMQRCTPCVHFTQLYHGSSLLQKVVYNTGQWVGPCSNANHSPISHSQTHLNNPQQSSLAFVVHPSHLTITLCFSLLCICLKLILSLSMSLFHCYVHASLCDTFCIHFAWFTSIKLLNTKKSTKIFFFPTQLKARVSFDISTSSIASAWIVYGAFSIYSPSAPVNKLFWLSSSKADNY